MAIAVVMLIKYLNYSTNPLWATADAASGGWNITGLLLAAASLYEYQTRPVSLFPSPPISVEKDKPIAPIRTTRTQRVLITLGLGSLIHMLQTFLMDAGTIVAWTWTGYPVSGPTLHPFGGVVILVTSLASTAVSYSPSTRVSILLWSIAAIGGSSALLYFPDWLGFNGGMVFTAYLVSILPRLFRSASALPLASTLGWALVVKILLDVASVVTAAYAFVPMGWLLRERTDLVLGFCVICIVAADVASLGLRLPGKDRLYPRSIKRVALIKRLNLLLAVLVAVLGLASSYRNMPTDKPVPYYPEHRMFTGGIFTVSTMSSWTNVRCTSVSTSQVEIVREESWSWFETCRWT